MGNCGGNAVNTNTGRTQLNTSLSIRLVKYNESLILINYIFHRLKLNSPHVPTTVNPVWMLNTTLVFLLSPGSVNGQQAECLELRHTLL